MDISEDKMSKEMEEEKPGIGTRVRDQEGFTAEVAGYSGDNIILMYDDEPAESVVPLEEIELEEIEEAAK